MTGFNQRQHQKAARARVREERRQERLVESLAAIGTRDYVFVKLVHCPACGSTRHQTERTERHDGVKSQRKTCRTCGYKFFLIFEDE